MSRLDLKLGALKAATEGITASAELKRRLVSLGSTAAAAAVMPFVVKLLIALAVVVASGALIRTMVGQEPPRDPVANEQLVEARPVLKQAPVGPRPSAFVPAAVPAEEVAAPLTEGQPSTPPAAPTAGLLPPSQRGEAARVPPPGVETSGVLRPPSCATSPASEVTIAPVRTITDEIKRLNSGRSSKDAAATLNRLLLREREDAARRAPVTYPGVPARPRDAAPIIISGRLGALPPADLSHIASQTDVDVGGWFVTTIDRAEVPVWFTLEGFEPLAVTAKVDGPGEYFLGVLLLERQRGAGASLHVETRGTTGSAQPEVTLERAPCPFNSPSESPFEVPQPGRSPSRATEHGPDVTFSGLPLTPARLTVRTPGYVTVLRTLNFFEPKRLELVVTPERAFEVTVQAFGPALPPEQQTPLTLHPIIGEPWEVSPRLEVFFHQEHGRLTLGAAGVKLGHGSIEQYRFAHPPKRLDWLGGAPLEDDTVFFLEDTGGQWMLLHVEVRPPR